MLLSKDMANSPETTGLNNHKVEGKDSNMSQSCGSERENNKNGAQGHEDHSHESSINDAVEVQKKANAEPAAKRRRLDVETGAEIAPARAADTSTSQAQQQDNSTLDAQQALIRQLLGNGNQTQAPSSQDLANTEIAANLRTIMMQQQLLLSGGYFPPQFGAAPPFPPNGTLNALSRLASLSGFGYPPAAMVNPLAQLQLLQQMTSQLTENSGSSAAAAGILGTLAAPSVPALTPQLTGRPSVPLAIEADQRTLSEFQRLVRKHIELFEAKQEDVESNAQGRNRPIVLGQVGIRCCHCAHLPPKLRCRGSTYYPTTLQGLYQAAQNMATGHLCKRCNHIPSDLREEMVRLKECKSSAGGGKTYWGDGVRSLGVIEAATGLRFLPSH